MSGVSAALVLVLAALPGRDQVAAGLFLVGALGLLARGTGLYRWLALGSAAASGICLLAPSRVGTAHTAEIFAGRAGLAVLAVLLLPRAIREARLLPLRLLVLLPPLACLASWLLPSVRMSAGSSATFTRAAIAFGFASFLVALRAHARASESLAFACVASCFFPGWRTLAVTFLEGWMLRPGDVPRLPARWEGALAPLSCLTMLLVFNGGYGLSHIDLTLIALGDDDPMHPSVPWGVVTVLFSYCVSLLLAIRLAARTAGDAAGGHIARALSAFLLFAGADLVWLGAARPGILLTLQFEGQAAFDLVLAGLLLVLLLTVSIPERPLRTP